MTRGIDALLAVERGFNATFVNGRNKKLYKKDRISALSKLFYQADRLAEADRIGAQRAVNDVLKNYKRSRRNSFVPDEKNILVQGESLFTELNKLTGPGSQNMASRFSELDPAQVYLTRFSETNETKKSMKIKKRFTLKQPALMGIL